MIAGMTAAHHRILFRRAFYICACQVVKQYVEFCTEQRAVTIFQMPFQLRLLRQDTVQAPIQPRVVKLAFFDGEQVIQRCRGIPALFNSQLAAWRAQPVDCQQRGHA